MEPKTAAKVVSEAAKLAGERLRRLREARDLTLEDVANKTGIDFSNLGRYERGTGETALRRYEQLAEFYGVDLGYLFRQKRSKRRSTAPAASSRAQS